MNMRGLVVVSILVLAPGVAGAEIPDPSAEFAEPPPAELPEIQQRFGVDGQVSIGFVVAIGGSVRYERRVKSEGYLTLRAGLYRGALLEDASSFTAPLANIGYRGYFGHVYLAIEGGIAGLRKDRWVDDDNDAHGVRWIPLPSVSLAIGGKISIVDFGVTALFPFVGVGVYLGFDFVRL
jgi:hypothetical protein